MKKNIILILSSLILFAELNARFNFNAKSILVNKKYQSIAAFTILGGAICYLKLIHSKSNDIGSKPKRKSKRQIKRDVKQRNFETHRVHNGNNARNAAFKKASKRKRGKSGKNFRQKGKQNF